MRVLCCHPSGLMYTKVFLRLEPLGLELVAAAIRRDGHDVRLLDLQVSSHKDFFKALGATTVPLLIIHPTGRPALRATDAARGPWRGRPPWP